MSQYSVEKTADGIQQMTFSELMGMAKELTEMLADAPDSVSSPENIAWWLYGWAENWSEEHRKDEK